MLLSLFLRGPRCGVVIVVIQLWLRFMVRFSLVKVGHRENFNQHDPEKKPERDCTPMVISKVTMGSLHGRFDRQERCKPDRGTELQGAVEDCTYRACHGCRCSLKNSNAVKSYLSGAMQRTRGPTHFVWVYVNIAPALPREKAGNT